MGLDREDRTNPGDALCAEGIPVPEPRITNSILPRERVKVISLNPERQQFSSYSTGLPKSTDRRPGL